jgi:hypothetical protein
MWYCRGAIGNTTRRARVKAEVPGRNDAERQFRAQLRTVLRNLERAIDDLFENYWEEPLRRYAFDIASALLQGCKAYGYLELASVARAMMSLLDLRMEDVLTLKDPMREKFTELIGLSKELAEILAA